MKISTTQFTREDGLKMISLGNSSTDKWAVCHTNSPSWFYDLKSRKWVYVGTLKSDRDAHSMEFYQAWQLMYELERLDGHPQN